MPWASANVLPQDIYQRESLSLDLLFAHANVHAPAINTALAQVEVSRADQIEAAFTLPSNPTLDLGGGARVAHGAVGFDYEFALTQTLEVFGEQQARRKAADLEVERARSLVDETRWLTHVEVHRLAMLWVLAQEQREYASMTVVFSENLARITQAQIDAGENSPLDLLIVQTDLAQAKAQFVQLTQQQHVIQVRLAAVIGWPSSTPFPSLEAVLPEPKEPKSMDILLAHMATQHPSMRQRELALQAQHAQLALAYKESMPTPSVGVSFARESAPGSPLVGPSQHAHIGMLMWSLPLTFWRRNQEGIARAEASIGVADRERIQTLVRLESELRIASSAVAASITTLGLYEEKIIPRLRQHFDLLERAYELGEVDLQQVSQTRERLLEGMTQYVRARTTYFERAATLEGLVGTEDWGTLPTREAP